MQFFLIYQFITFENKVSQQILYNLCQKNSLRQDQRNAEICCNKLDYMVPRNRNTPECPWPILLLEE